MQPIWLSWLVRSNNFKDENMNFRLTDTHVYFLGGYFSQWAHSPFSGAIPGLRYTSSGQQLHPVGTIRFSCCEQYMMAAKAMMFEDQETLLEIMDATHPGDMKRLGRKVKNFDVDVWNRHARDVVYLGNFYKFTQHNGAKDFMDHTKDKIVVEGADYDKIWGVGIAWDDPQIEDEASWQGTNWLGQCIMRVREDRSIHGDSINPWTLLRAW